MAYIFVKEVVGDEKVAQVYKISGMQEWATKFFERSHHAVAEDRFSTEEDAVKAAYDWAKPTPQIKESKISKKKTSTDE